MEGSSILSLLLIAALIFFAFRIFAKCKVPKVGCMALVSGGVKTGKTTLAVYLAYKNWQRNHRRWRVRSFFKAIFHLPKDEEPLLYSNIPLAVPYVPITKELLLRENRFRYGSSIYISEASLVADSQLIRDPVLNERLLHFNKLIGHSTRGGQIIYDTQSITDLHYSIKRCLSEYLYIHHLVKWIPFFLLAYVREERYSEDGSVVSVHSDDVEETLRKVIIPKRVWKLFDPYCYSKMTDHLPVVSKVVRLKKGSSLKIDDYVSFREKTKK